MHVVVQNLEIAFQVMQYHSRRLTYSDQNVIVNSKQMSDQRMVFSIFCTADVSLLSIFLISHLKTIWPYQTTKNQTKTHEQDLWSLFLARSASTPCVCKNQTTKLWPELDESSGQQGEKASLHPPLDRVAENHFAMQGKFENRLSSTTLATKTIWPC